MELAAGREEARHQADDPLGAVHSVDGQVFGVTDLHQPTVNPRAAVPLQALDVLLHGVARVLLGDELHRGEQQVLAEAPLPIVGRLHVGHHPHPDGVLYRFVSVHLPLPELVKPQVEFTVMGEHGVQVGHCVENLAGCAVPLRGRSVQVHQAGRRARAVAVPIGGCLWRAVVAGASVRFPVEEATAHTCSTKGADDLQALSGCQGIGKLLPCSAVCKSLGPEVYVYADRLARSLPAGHGAGLDLRLVVGCELPLSSPLFAQSAYRVRVHHRIGGADHIHRLHAPTALGV